MSRIAKGPEWLRFGNGYPIGVSSGSVRQIASEVVTPWGEVKSKRGRRKQYSTDRLACLNPGRAYFEITNEAVQALLLHTTRGKDRDIAYQACQAVFAGARARHSLPHEKPERMEMVLWFLVEGVRP
jgi:hypothetical protein